MTFQSTSYLVFISSTSDLLEYRSAARAMLLDKLHIPVAMDNMPSDPNPPRRVVERFVQKCDALLLIVGERYGSIVPGEDISYTELEYRLACGAQKPVFPLVFDLQGRALASDDAVRLNRFIDKLKANNLSKFFEKASFQRDLALAIDNIVEYLGHRAGLVRYVEAAAAIDDLEKKIVTANDRIGQLDARLKGAYRSRRLAYEIFDALSDIHSRLLSQLQISDGITMNRLNQQNDSLRKLIHVITSEWQEYPILHEIVAAKLDGLAHQLHGLIDPHGYQTRDIEELKNILERLFSSTLVQLKATSIHSSREDLRACNTYWDDPTLGPFFNAKNRDFLRGGGKVQRIYICDSVVRAVGEAWFKDMAMDQIRSGAMVKVVNIQDDPVAVYEDFGVYTHRTAGPLISSYILSAPRELNPPGSLLRTALISETDSRYEAAFDSLWNSSGEALSLRNTQALADAANRPVGEFGEASVNQMFSGCVVLRNMVRLDTSEKLLDDGHAYPRKYEQPYSVALARHIRTRFTNVDRIFYFGDTHINDAAVIRNLQSMGFEASGFICEPELHIKNLWFNGVYYSDRWTDVLGYLELIAHAASGPNRLAIFDIDQTVWAPKGLLDAPLSATRTAAMHTLLDRYIESGRSEFTARTRDLITAIYRIIKGIDFNILTQDNEDYKAAISLCLALNLYKAPDKRFALLAGGKMLPDELEWAVADKVLKPYLVDGGIVDFIGDVYAELDSPEVEEYAKQNGIRLLSVRNDVRNVYRAIRQGNPTPFTEFRRREFAQALARTGTSGNLAKNDRMVINKTIWDVIAWLRKNSVQLLALSDRPDEATYSETQSLLDSPMCVFGRSVETEISRLAEPKRGAQTAGSDAG